MMFGEKRYVLYEHTPPIQDKRKAAKAADDYRETGDRIRIVKTSRGYRLYGR